MVEKTTGDSTEKCYPTENDVLFGKGKKIQDHTGNKKFRNLCYEKEDQYKGKDPDTGKCQKTSTSLEIISIIKNKHKGRFLKFNEVTKKYYEVNDEKIIRKKISDVLREYRRTDKNDYTRKNRNCKKIGGPPVVLPVGVGNRGGIGTTGGGNNHVNITQNINNDNVNNKINQGRINNNIFRPTVFDNKYYYHDKSSSVSLQQQQQQHAPVIAANRAGDAAMNNNNINLNNLLQSMAQSNRTCSIMNDIENRNLVLYKLRRAEEELQQHLQEQQGLLQQQEQGLPQQVNGYSSIGNNNAIPSLEGNRPIDPVLLKLRQEQQQKFKALQELQEEEQGAQQEQEQSTTRKKEQEEQQPPQGDNDRYDNLDPVPIKTDELHETVADHLFKKKNQQQQPQLSVVGVGPMLEPLPPVLGREEEEQEKPSNSKMENEKESINTNASPVAAAAATNAATTTTIVTENRMKEIFARDPILVKLFEQEQQAQLHDIQQQQEDVAVASNLHKLQQDKQEKQATFAAASGTTTILQEPLQHGNELIDDFSFDGDDLVGPVPMNKEGHDLSKHQQSKNEGQQQEQQQHMMSSEIDLLLEELRQIPEDDEYDQQTGGSSGSSVSKISKATAGKNNSFTTTHTTRKRTAADVFETSFIPVHRVGPPEPELRRHHHDISFTRTSTAAAGGKSVVSPHLHEANMSTTDTTAMSMLSTRPDKIHKMSTTRPGLGMPGMIFDQGKQILQHFNTNMVNSLHERLLEQQHIRENKIPFGSKDSRSTTEQNLIRENKVSFASIGILKPTTGIAAANKTVTMTPTPFEGMAKNKVFMFQNTGSVMMANNRGQFLNTMT